MQNASPQAPANAVDGGGDKVVEEAEQENRQGVGDDGSSCPSFKEKATVLQDMRRINEGSSWGTNSEDQGDQLNFGPWMLSKKPLKKRNVGSAPSRVNKSTVGKGKMG